MRFLSLVLSLLLLIACTQTTPAANIDANTLEQVRASLKSQDYQTALKLLQPLADQGNAEAQWSIGAMYGRGMGVTQSYPEALKWQIRAAEQGYPGAAHYVAQMYQQGTQVKGDHKEAYKWNLRAAKQGDADAMGSFGLWYREKWYGYTPDFVQAYMWYSLQLAREKGRHAMTIRSLDKLAQKMSLEQIAEAKSLAAKWPEIPLPPFPAYPFIEEKVPLERWRYARDHRPSPAEEAAETDRKIAILLPSAERGEPHAQFKVGMLMRDKEQAFKWLLKSAKQGHVYAQEQIGKRYLLGEGVKKNCEEAKKWYRKAADHGYERAQTALSSTYTNSPINTLNLNCKRSDEEACFWNVVSDTADPQGCKIFLPSITAEQISSVEKRARAWKPIPVPVGTPAPAMVPR
jgi:uncharacterized protein